MQVHQGHRPRDFFSLKPRDTFWNPPYLGNAMSIKRFERINEYIKIDDEQEAPENRDIFFWAR